MLLDYPVKRALYLDDLRPLPEHGHFIEWFTLVKSFEEFAEHIIEHGLPDLVSFDHDLHEEHVRIASALDWKDFDYSACTVGTGYHCAKWLITYCVDTKQPLPYFTVHSANTYGATRIVQLLNNFKLSRGEQPDGYITFW